MPYINYNGQTIEITEAELELFKLAQAGDLQKVIGQLEINAKEAQSTSIFVAGWRPFVGWVSGLGVFWAAIGQPIFSYVAVIKGWPAAPTIDTEVLLYVLGGMLGLGTLRTVEKSKGVA